MLERTLSERKNINRERDFLFITHTHTHSLGRMSERRSCWDKRERDYCCREIIFMFSGFTFGADSISKEVAGFSPLWFPKGKYLCLLSLVFDCRACYSLS